MCVTRFLLARIRKTRIAFLYPKHMYLKYRRVSVLSWSLLHYNWVLDLYDRSVIENWFQRAFRSPVIRTSFVTCQAVWRLAVWLSHSLLIGIPDVPGKILGLKDDCTYWDCLQFTLLLPENWLNGVKLAVSWIFKLSAFYGVRRWLLRWREFVTWSHPVGFESCPHPQSL
jgi:hypothetical protein